MKRQQRNVWWLSVKNFCHKFHGLQVIFSRFDLPYENMQKASISFHYFALDDHSSVLCFHSRKMDTFQSLTVQIWWNAIEIFQVELFNQFQNMVTYKVLIFNSISIRKSIAACRNSQSFFFFFSVGVRLRSRDQGRSGIRGGKVKAGYVYGYRPCLWIHTKALLIAYLDDVNKTKDEIELI